MTADIYLAKQSLFTPLDENDIIQYEQLEGVNITFPISMTILEKLHQFSPQSLQSIKVLLDDIIQNPSYYFPAVPLEFNRSSAISMFVPHDNTYKLNWKALIIQAHISLLKALGWEKIMPKKKMFSEDLAQSRPSAQDNSSNRGGFIGSRGTLGSLSIRQQKRYVSSFSRNPVGSLSKPAIGSISINAAPQLIREIFADTQAPVESLELNPIFDFTFNCSFDESNLFRALVIAVQAHGSLDIVCGKVLAAELAEQLSSVNIQVGEIRDAMPSIEAYFTLLDRGFLSQEAEDQIRSDIAEDKIASVLNTIEQLSPFILVNHTYQFIESCLAPLCYHENIILATRASNLYHTLLNGHSWELQETNVTTCDIPLNFVESSEHTVLISTTGSTGEIYLTSLGVGVSMFKAPGAGFYDWAYARINSNGEYEVDPAMPSGRTIVLANAARAEFIHDLPAFNDKGPVEFSKLSESLEDLKNKGITAVHVSGVFERQALYSMTSVTDHTLFSKKCGGLEGFKEFSDHAKQLGIRVLIDYSPLVSLYSSRKYNSFSALQCDERGRLLTASIPGSDNLLLNMRSIDFWNLMTTEIITLIETAGVSGFYFGNIKQWDIVFPRNMKELTRLDPDDQHHYNQLNIIQGSVVLDVPLEDSRGMLSHHDTKSSPLIIRLMRAIWSKLPTAFVWAECDADRAPFLINSGLIAQTHDLQDVLIRQIEKSTHCEDVYSIDAGKEIKNFLQNREDKLPKGSLCITPFGSLADPQVNMTHDGLGILAALLYFLSDVPLIQYCSSAAYYVPNAYSINSNDKQIVRKWYPPCSKFSQLLMDNSFSRQKASWDVLSGELKVLPVTYDGQENNAVLAFARVNHQTEKSEIICTGFYQDNLIFEVGINSMNLVQGKPDNWIVQVDPIIAPPELSLSYYSIPEVVHDGSSLFLEVTKFGTSVFEVQPINPMGNSQLTRHHMEDAFTRLSQAISTNTRTILSHNYMFLNILKLFDGTLDDKMPLIEKVINELPLNNDAAPFVFRQALFHATRNQYDNQKLIEITDESIIEKREMRALEIMKILIQSRDDEYCSIGKKIIESNTLGPVFFIAPELGPFSKVGGLSTMVWELAQELAALGLDIHCISPYYNVNSKGETGYLKKQWNIEYQKTIEIFCPEGIKLGIHYGEVNGVKLWFLHNYSYFAAPYQTGSTSFRLQTMVLLTKGSLELCCQVRKIPSLVVTNDWMTGFTPAYALKSFGQIFKGTRFLHIFHNLGAGYAGKIWPSDGDLYSLRPIHQLPDEYVVDGFDHSIDPSLCALMASDQWATVSKKYRDELLEGSPYQYLLRDRFSRPFAYSNGIRIQERLEKLKTLGMDHDQAKAALQQKYFGKADPSKCVFVFVGRITEQKGVFLIIDSFEELHRQYGGRMQFIVGGQAMPDDRSYGLPCTQKMMDLKNRFPDNFWADPSAFFTDGLLACQGADYTLVPSLFEPSGIVQQESFCSGTPVIAFRTGGLADTVFEYDKEKNTGNGFTFWAHRHNDYIYALQRAFDLWDKCKDLYEKMRVNAFKSTLSTVTVATAWAREFCRLFEKIYEPPTVAKELNELKSKH